MLAVFFFNDTATTEIYTLSLHDALPIWTDPRRRRTGSRRRDDARLRRRPRRQRGRAHRLHRVWIGVDRKSTRLNSSHANISYAVFCLKKKKINIALLLVYLSNSTSSMSH